MARIPKKKSERTPETRTEILLPLRAFRRQAMIYPSRPPRFRV